MRVKREVDAIAWSDVGPHLRHALANGGAIAEMSGHRGLHALHDARLAHAIGQVRQPAIELGGRLKAVHAAQCIHLDTSTQWHALANSPSDVTAFQEHGTKWHRSDVGSFFSPSQTISS